MNTQKLPIKNYLQKGTGTFRLIRHFIIIVVFYVTVSVEGFSQNVGISANGAATDASAGLDVNFTNKGLLIPRVSLTSTADAATISTPATSLLVYNINAGMSGGGVGYWYWNGSSWVKLLSGGVDTTAWSTLGNGGSVYGTNFLGTTDNTGLSLRTNNVEAFHIDSLRNVSIGIPNTTNKFEVAGTFRLHKDSFNLLQTPDLFPSALPNIRYVGSTYRIPSLNGTFLNGIAHTPLTAGDAPSAITGYIDFPSGTQNIFAAGEDNISINSVSGIGSSSINFQNNGNMNLSTQFGSDTSNNISFQSDGIYFNHGKNNIGNTSMNFNDTSVFININENVTNSRNSSVQMQPGDYNFYNSDNANNTYSGINFNSKRSNLYFNSGAGNTHLELTDSSYDQYIGESITNSYTGIVTKADNNNIYNNDNANNNYSGLSFNSKEYDLYVSSSLHGSNFHMTDSSAFFTSSAQSKFGIGTTLPTNALHVNSSPDPVRFEGLQSGASSDNVVTIDATGVLHYSAAGAAGWGLTGNAGTNSTVNFLGTTDAQDLKFQVNSIQAGRLTTDGQTFLGLNAGLNNIGTNNTALGGSSLFTNTSGITNTAVGMQALYSNTIASGNTAVGAQALYTNTIGFYNTSIGVNSLFSNTIGYYNTASGINSLYNNTEGGVNTATGTNTLYSNTTGSNNTAMGEGALYYNTTASYNTATGTHALYSNTTGADNAAFGNGALLVNVSGNSNSAIGNNALVSNTTGGQNTASGQQSINSNTGGSQNTASGYQSLYGNTTGIGNTASGYRALFSNATTDYNTATGYRALYNMSGGSSNTAIGHEAQFLNNTGSNNTAVGHLSLFTNKFGSNNTALGYGADISADNLSNATAIGYNAIAGASNSLVLGGIGADQVNVGVGTSTPNSYLETAGSFGTAIITTTANVTLDNTHFTVIVTGGTPTITLPAPGATNNRRSYRIINQTSAVVTISGYIDFTGLAAISMTGNSKIEVQSDGTNWYRVD